MRLAVFVKQFSLSNRKRFLCILEKLCTRARQTYTARFKKLRLQTLLRWDEYGEAEDKKLRSKIYLNFLEIVNSAREDEDEGETQTIKRCSTEYEADSNIRATS